MKKVLLAASLLIAVVSFAGNFNGATNAAYAQASGGGIHIPASKVPASIRATFNAQYPTATNVSWEVEREHGQLVYQATFLLNGVKMKVKYPA